MPKGRMILKRFCLLHLPKIKNKKARTFKNSDENRKYILLPKIPYSDTGILTVKKKICFYEKC